MSAFRNTNELIDSLVARRREDMMPLWEDAEVVYQEPEDPDVAYRNKILDNIEDLAESIRQNISKIGADTTHYYVTSLIEVENALRDLNEDICSFCDASNNMAIEDSEKLNDKLDQLGNFDEFETQETPQIGVQTFVVDK